MEKIANGLVAKLMDEFVEDIVTNCEDEGLADILQTSWLTDGVPDESDFIDCINFYGDDESFYELKGTFITLIEIANVGYSQFENYVNYVLTNNFLSRIENCLTRELKYGIIEG